MDDPSQEAGQSHLGKKHDSGRKVLAFASRTFPVAAGGYAVAALFVASYIVLRLIWKGLEPSSAITVASVVAIPLGIALIWPRLTGLKLFGLEITLSRFVAQIDTTIDAALGEAAYFSGREHIIAQIERTIARPEIGLVEVNLRDGQYWAQTRLYLLSALADDFSRILQLVFVADGDKRSFIGLATPACVRKAISAEFPLLEVAYLHIRQGDEEKPAAVSVQDIVNRWTTHAFDRHPFNRSDDRKRDLVVEKDVVVKVTRELLIEWRMKVGIQLATDSVEWRGFSEPELVRGLVRDFDVPYVALLRGGSLDRVVNRLLLTARVAQRTVG